MVYYNRMIGKVIFDVLDYFLLSALIVSYLVPRFTNYFSEHSKMERLREDLKSNSKLIESFPLNSKVCPKLTPVQKVYKLALGTRGGQLGYKSATKVQEFFMKLAVFLQRRRNREILNSLLAGARLTLTLFLSIYGIELQYIVVNPVSKEVIVVSMVAGGATGFVLSWIAAATTITVPPIILAILTLRSSFQQVVHNRECAKIQSRIKWLIQNQDREYRLTLQSVGKLENLSAKETAKQLDVLGIKEISERFAIFDDGPIHIEENSVILDSAKKMGFTDHPIPKPRIRAKSTNLSELLSKLDKDSVSKPNSIIMDAEVVEVLKEPLRIRIKEE